MQVNSPIQQVSAQDAWNALTHNKDACLIDVRTQVEWEAVGVVDLPESQVIYLTLVDHQGVLNPDFISFLEQADTLKKRPLYFLCKIGGRSQKAAELAAYYGFEHLFNIVGGFEGIERGLSESSSPSALTAGWKNRLPSKQYIP